MLESQRPSSPRGLIDAIDAAIGRSGPDRDFLTTAHEKISYATLGQRIARLNAMFREMGLRPADRVAIVSDDDAAVIPIVVASLRAGLTAVVGDGRGAMDELVRLLEASDPAALFADGSLLETAAGPIRLPESRVVGLRPHRFAERLEPFQPLAEFPDVAPDALALIVFTSGTTSRPRGACLTHANLEAQFDAFGEVYGFDERSRLLNVLPLHHVDGLIRGPLAALRFGSQLHRPMRFSVPELEALLSFIPSEEITHFVTVPAMLGLIHRLADPDSSVFRTEALRFVICSADHLDPDLWTRFENRFGIEVVNAYGLSEVVCDVLFCGPHEETRLVGSLGKPVSCGARVVDDTGRDAATGETGELILNGPLVMQGYFRQPEESARVLRDGWLYTGDLVSRDPQGFFHFEGRKKSVVIVGGATVHPENVTTTLRSLPGVADAVCYGAPDEAWGQRLVACVVAEPGEKLDEAHVIHQCRERLAPEKVPSEIHFLETLPRGASGKILVDAVRDRVSTTSTKKRASDDLFEIAAACFQVPVGALSLDSTPFNTEGWDSMAHLAFIGRLEEAFDFTLSPTEILEIASLADAKTILDRNAG